MTRYREHRGGYDDSMATTVPCETWADLEAIIGHKATVEPYGGIDQRNGWDTHVVIVEKYGKRYVMGFTDGMPLDNNDPLVNTRRFSMKLYDDFAPVREHFQKHPEGREQFIKNIGKLLTAAFAGDFNGPTRGGL